MVENITFEKCCFNLIWPMKILMENSKRKCDGYRQERCHLGESCIEPGLVICCNVIFGWRGLVEDYLGYRVLDSDSSCLALYFFQSENLLSGKRWHGRGRPGLGLGKHFGGEEPGKVCVACLLLLLRHLRDKPLRLRPAWREWC